MADPANYDEYVKRVNLNQSVSGFGAATTMHLPCPFCGAADFMCYAIINTQKGLANGAVCKECGRGAKCLFDGSDNSIGFELVQTSGPDQPEYLPVKLRRIS